LGLAGYVRNMVDGSVEVVARGPRADLAHLEQALTTGPSMARVDRVEKIEVSHQLDVTNPFEIR
jgi:acylphosphatase